MTKKLFSISYLLYSTVLLGCSSYINYQEKKSNFQILPPDQKEIACHQSLSFQYAGQSDWFNKTIAPRLKKVSVQKKFNFAEEIALFSLANMLTHPHSFSPSSRIQILIKGEGLKYFDFDKSKERSEKATPGLFGLHYLLKQYKSKYHINDLLRLLPNIIPTYIPVFSDIKDFIEENSEQLKKNKKLKKLFFKGNQALVVGERFKRSSTDHLRSSFSQRDHSLYQINTHLFHTTGKNKNFPIDCNFDLRIYENSIYPIRKNMNIVENIFSITHKNQTAIVTTQSNASQLSTYKNTSVLNFSQPSPPAAFCSVKNTSENQQLFLVSNNDRDPAQHIQHLIRYGINQASSVEVITEILKQPRHLYLFGPSRMVFESSRSNENELSDLLSLGLPIYHVPKLGNIWGAYSSHNKSSLIIDDRNQGNLLCKLKSTVKHQKK